MSLGKNASYALGSSALQIIVTLITIPIYLSVIGVEKYGVLVIIWLLFDYLLLFSLSIDRATVNLVSQARSNHELWPKIFWSAITITVASSTLGALIAIFGLSGFMHSVMSAPPALVDEIGWGVAAVGCLLVATTVGNIFAALLQTEERFLEVSIAQFVMSLAFQVLPVLLAWSVSADMQTLVVTGCLARALQPLLYVLMVRRKGIPPGRIGLVPAQGKRLIQFGAWATVTGAVSPLLFSLDRFFVSAMLGPTAVGFYSVTYNLVMRAQLLPGSLSTVLFPRLSQDRSLEERRSTAEQAIVLMGIIFAAGLIFGSHLLNPFLAVWLAGSAPFEVVLVGQVLIFGIWFNGLAIIPFVWLQATGRPDTIAKIHLFEAVPFVVCLFFMVQSYGMIGAAAVWSARAVVDALALFHLSKMLTSLAKDLAVPTLLIVATLLLNSFAPMPWLESSIVAALSLLILGIWSLLWSPTQVRLRLRHYIGRIASLRPAR